MTRLVREPFVHFILLGCLIFAAYAWFNRGQAEADHIVIDQAQFDHLRELWKIQWKRDPNETETRALLERYLRQEVFYREALRMGLDKNDDIIRKRLAEKMEAVADDLGMLMRPPEEAQLRAYYRAHPADFTLPQSYAFEQVLLLPDEPGREATQATLLRDLEAGGAIPRERKGKLGMRNDWALTPVPELDNAFGEGFGQALADLPTGRWAGPVRSGLGWHLVKLVQQQPPTLLPFEQVRADVAREYEYRNELATQDQVYRELLQRYTVEVPATGISPATRAALGAR